MIRQIPSRHRRVADAVIDVGENLPIRQRRKQLEKGRNARIDMFADGRAAGSVEIVTNRAFLLKCPAPAAMVASSGFSGLTRAAASAGTLFRRSQVATSISISGGSGARLRGREARSDKERPAPRTSRTRSARTIFPHHFAFERAGIGRVRSWPALPVSLGRSSANRAFRRWRHAPSDRKHRRAPCPPQAARDRRNTCATSQARRREGPTLRREIKPVSVRRPDDRREFRQRRGLKPEFIE